MALNKEILNKQLKQDFDVAFRNMLDTLLSGRGEVSIYTVYNQLATDFAKSVSNRVDTFIKSGDVKTTVNTAVNTAVVTAGTATAQTGKGTGAGQGAGQGKVY